jgi:antitoxin (DNA-binding transcriptional repressor) of toxin-antitoxin stability system
VKIGRLRDHLSRYLAAARRGERVIVMDRETPIAEIGPISSGPEAAASGRVELARRGVIVLAGRPGLSLREVGAPLRCRADTVRAVRADRDAD